jgi:hypothetical protein
LVRISWVAALLQFVVAVVALFCRLAEAARSLTALGIRIHRDCYWHSFASATATGFASATGLLLKRFGFDYSLLALLLVVLWVPYHHHHRQVID